MTAPSPVQLATGNAEWAITSNGQPLASTVQVVSIDVWTGANKVPRARLVVSDGSPAAEDFPISEGQSLIPGAKVTISMGYNGALVNVFSGVVYSQGLSIGRESPSRLIVELADKSLVMTLARQNAIFQNVTDSQVCAQLIAAAGLSGKVSTTSVTHEVIVQYYATAWDLMVLRAQASGMLVTVDEGVVTVAPPNTAAAPVLTLTYGESVLDFRATMDSSTQFAPSAIKSYAWDPATQALVVSSTPSSNVTTPGNISSESLANVFGVKQYLQQSAGQLASSELTAWSSAELTMSQLSKIRGTVRFQGSALCVPGCTVTLAGLGDRFNGNGLVGGVLQSLSGGHWVTTAEIGLSPQVFAESAPNVAAAGAAGLLPPVNAVLSGVVLQIANDPEGEFRVLVSLPLLQSASGLGVWARLGSFYASSSVGAFFYPEVGDEVLVAFLSGDPRYPVILGSLYSKKNQPPFTPDAKNNTKSICSRSKLHIDFDEQNKSISLVTPGNQTVTIDDNAKSIALTDMNGNSVKLGSGGITISSSKDITLTASGSITVSAGVGLSLSATTSLSATSKTSTKISSTGPIDIKGAAVALNP